MAFADAMATLSRLVAQAEALAALGARLRADAEGVVLDPAIEAALDGVVAALGVDPAALEPAERAMVASYARAFLHRPWTWSTTPSIRPGGRTRTTASWSRSAAGRPR